MFNPHQALHHEAPPQPIPNRKHYSLAILPHPDDEIMISGALCSLAPLSRITVLYLTNGEASTKGDQAFVGAGLRRQESVNALGTIGIPQRNIRFLGLPDGRLHEPKVQARASESLAELLTKLSVSMLLTLGPEGFDRHPDHIASHRIAHTARNSHEDLLKVALLGLTPTTGTNSGRDRRSKLDLLRHHPSQFGGPADRETVGLVRYITTRERYHNY